MSSEKEKEISKIVESLTTTGKKTLDDSLMKKLKSICKVSNENVGYAYYVLMTSLRKEHSEVRYSALLIINELFIRSSVFRTYLENDFHEFLELVIETNLDKPLPLPLMRAKDLKLKGLELVKNWVTKYRSHYKRLEMALNYLKSCKKIDFNDMEVRSEAQRERQRQEQERLQRIINERVKRTQTEMHETAEDISNILLQIENCFRLLVPHPTGELFSSEDFQKSSTEEYSASNCDNTSSTFSLEQMEGKSSENTLRHHGIHDMKKIITINLNSNSSVNIKADNDTLPIIENVNDFHKQLASRYLPMVTNWLKILTKGNNCTDSLKKAIDLKQLIESAMEKYKDLKINPGVSVIEDEEDDFIEVKEKEGYESDSYQETRLPCFSEDLTKPSTSKFVSNNEKAFMWKLKQSKDDYKDPTTAASSVSKFLKNIKTDLTSLSSVQGTKKNTEKKSDKSELLDKAPIMPYDIDLYHWEDEKPVLPERVKFDSLHKFWETKDNDDYENETLKEVQMASLRTRKIDFSGKFEPVKWSCRVPLPNGKLCPRKDRYKCPFHGKIVKRDCMGNPYGEFETSSMAGPSTSTSLQQDIPEWQDPSLLKDIEAATGVNLEMPKKKGQKRKKKDGLTNIKKVKVSGKERIIKKIVKRYKHYSKKLDDVDRKRFNDKFGDQWNYY